MTEHIPINTHTHTVRAKSLQLCPTLCDPMNCSPPGSSVHGILQARILEWVVMPSSGGISPILNFQPGSPALQVDSLLLSDQGSPTHTHTHTHTHTEDCCFEQNFFGDEKEFKVMAVTPWLQALVSVWLL